jgi:hypothetical protein
MPIVCHPGFILQDGSIYICKLRCPPFPQLRLDLVKLEPEDEEEPAQACGAASSSDPAWGALENELLHADLEDLQASDDHPSAGDHENLDCKKYF